MRGRETILVKIRLQPQSSLQKGSLTLKTASDRNQENVPIKKKKACK
jgi:hypothetical protein